MPEVGLQEQLPNAQEWRDHPLSVFCACKLLLKICRNIIRYIFSNKFPSDLVESGRRLSAFPRSGWRASRDARAAWVGRSFPRAPALIAACESSVSRASGQAYASPTGFSGCGTQSIIVGEST
jgi:hypothetical protein